MSGLKYTTYRAMFEVLALSRLSNLIRKFSSAKGVIFTLHRVLPDPPPAFSPNAILQVRPDFLEAAILRSRAAGFEIVDLDEAARRLTAQEQTRPFVAFTFDDAYKDNLTYALPVMRRHGAPFTLYVPTAFVDGVGALWWQALEDIIAANDAIATPFESEVDYLETKSVAQKEAAFKAIYWRLRGLPEDRRREAIREMTERYRFDLAAQCRALIMDWTELRTFADDPLCTIGAHTVHHYELAKLSRDDARWEMAESASIIRRQFGREARHFSYPIGHPTSAGPREFELARELGFATAVTTRPGGLYPDHAAHLTALPRISLNGHFQQQRYLDTLLTGAIFTAMNRGRRLDVA